MNKKINPFIYRIDEDGNSFATDNPEYIKYIQTEKFKLFFKKSGIPEFYFNIEFSDYIGDRKSKEYIYIKKYAENCHKKEFNHTHLFLYGIHSTQKSALAYNVGKLAIKNGLNVKAILAGTLIDKLMKLQGFNYIESIYEEIKQLKQSDLLIIDDFGDPNKVLSWKGESKNLIIGAWDTFLREILASNTKLVMTSNYSIKFIEGYYGSSLYELIDRNFIALLLNSSVKEVRKLKVQSAFEGME